MAEVRSGRERAEPGWRTEKCCGCLGKGRENRATAGEVERD